jgi:hypothetical protein
MTAVLRGFLTVALAVLPPALAPAAEAPATGPITVIQAGELLAVPGKAPMRNQTLVVRGQRVVAIRDGILGGE